MLLLQLALDRSRLLRQGDLKPGCGLLDRWDVDLDQRAFFWERSKTSRHRWIVYLKTHQVGGLIIIITHWHSIFAILPGVILLPSHILLFFVQLPLVSNLLFVR